MNSLLRLFGVMESDCDHEWLNHSFDQFGFLQEQICDKMWSKAILFHNVGRLGEEAPNG